MDHRGRGMLAAIGLAAVLAAGCGESPGPSPLASVACVLASIRLTLHVDPADPRGMWGSRVTDEGEVTVRPRPGLKWRVEAGPEGGVVVDADGATVTFEGEIAQQACYEAATGTYYIGPEDLPDLNRPPN